MAKGNLIAYIFIIIFSSFSQYGYAETTLNAGLLFEQVSSQEQPVNGRRLSFMRQVPIRPLYEALDKMEQAMKLFKETCTQATKSIDEKSAEYQRILTAKGLTEETKFKTKVELKWGPQEYMRVAAASCKKIHAELIEIRSEDHYNMVPHTGLRTFPANVYFDLAAQRIKYVSDESEPHVTTYNFGGYIDIYDTIQSHVKLNTFKSSTIPQILLSIQKWQSFPSCNE